MSGISPAALPVSSAASGLPAPAVELESAAAALGGRMIWSQASFAIQPGEFVTILGPNGAGKSTLLKVVLGLLPLQAGAVRVFAQAPRRERFHTGYVPQRRTLDTDLNVRGRTFVRLGFDGHRWGFPLPFPVPLLGKRAAQNTEIHSTHDAASRIQEAIEAVEAEAYADRPMGQLSGGEQQRLLLAQALVGNPRLLLLDEPLASLDLRNQQAISQLVARLAREREMTVMLVSHDLNPLLGVLDRLVYVARGKVAIGSPDTILTTENLSKLYDGPVEVLRDSQGHVFVVGLEAEGHPL